MIDTYNIIIIGGGPAGISAGIYGKYDGNRPLILEAKTLAWIPKNHVNLLGKLEGFPALLNTINGNELIDRFKDSLNEMKVEYRENTRVNSIVQKGSNFIVNTNAVNYKTNAVVLATGTLPLKLPNNLVGDYKKDVFYFAYNKFKNYINKEVVVLGSRNSGSSAAIYLAKHGLKVTIIEIKPEIQAKEKYTKYFKELGVRTITNAIVKKLSGKNKKLQFLYFSSNDIEYRINCQAIFCYIGIVPNIKLASSLGVKLDENNYVSTNFYQTTNIDGIFVAGDICGDLKHIIAACGQGAKAAYNVNKYLNYMDGVKSLNNEFKE